MTIADRNRLAALEREVAELRALVQQLLSRKPRAKHA
jgi:hypothetical protein